MQQNFMQQRLLCQWLAGFQKCEFVLEGSTTSGACPHRCQEQSSQTAWQREYNVQQSICAQVRMREPLIIGLLNYVFRSQRPQSRAEAGKTSRLDSNPSIFISAFPQPIFCSANLFTASYTAPSAVRLCHILQASYCLSLARNY